MSAFDPQSAGALCHWRTFDHAIIQESG